MPSLPPPFSTDYTLVQAGCRISLYDRYWAKVDVRAEHDCWLWLAGTGSKGYGRFGIHGHLQGPKVWDAHRVAYTLTFGPIPTGMEIDHVCHTQSTTCTAGMECPHRMCVNPKHLQLVTHRENAVRRDKRVLTCPRGHLKSGLRYSNGPDSRCGTCHRVKQAQFRATGRYEWPVEVPA